MPTVAAVQSRRFPRVIGPGIEPPVQITFKLVTVVEPMHQSRVDQRNVHGLVHQRAALIDAHRIEPQLIAAPLRLLEGALPRRKMVQFGNPDLQPVLTVRRLDRVNPAEFRRMAMHKLGGFPPVCDVVVGGFVANVEKRLVEPLFLAQMVDEKRQELGQELLAGNLLRLAVGLVVDREKVIYLDFRAIPSAWDMPRHKAGFHRIHEACFPKNLRIPVELREVQAVVAILIHRGFNQRKADLERVVPVFDHVLCVSPQDLPVTI